MKNPYELEEDLLPTICRFCESLVEDVEGSKGCALTGSHIEERQLDEKSSCGAFELETDFLDEYNEATAEEEEYRWEEI